MTKKNLQNLFLLDFQIPTMFTNRINPCFPFISHKLTNIIHGKPHEIPSLCQHFSKVKSHCSLWRVWKTTKIVPPLEIKRGGPLGNPLCSWASIYLSVYLSHLSIYLSSYLSIYLIYLSHPSIHPSIYPSIYLSICLSVQINTQYIRVYIYGNRSSFFLTNRRIVIWKNPFCLFQVSFHKWRSPRWHWYP